jgi:glycosyltransferase involved in cell wall biosynthesis
MSTLYSLAKAFVYPSNYEWFSLPVLEAMACGTAFITSNISSLSEIVGDAGLLISSFNRLGLVEAMHSTIHQPEMVGLISSKAEVRAALFIWHKTGLETLSVLRRVTGK